MRTCGIIVMTVGLALWAGCASGPVNRAEMSVDCSRLTGTTPGETGLTRVDMDHDVRNPSLVRQRIDDLYRGRDRLEAWVQLLVHPDGTIASGCVRRPSGDRDYDRAVLRALELAVFQSEFLGESDVWLLLPVSNR